MADQSETSEVKPGLVDEKKDLLQLDYEQTVEQFRMLTDIRFKLLALVPTLTGAAVGLLTNTNASQATALPLGIFGFVVTFGIVMYELRNSVFYEMSTTRAARLESLLELPRFSEPRDGLVRPGGVFTERPPAIKTKEAKEYEYPLPQKIAGFFPVWHDLGLALVYGASLAGWTYLVLYSLLLNNGYRLILSLLVGALVLILTVIQFIILDWVRRKWRCNYVKPYNLYRKGS